MFGTRCKNNKGLSVGRTDSPAGRTGGRGFTIIEIVVVIAIITTVFIAILSFFVFDAKVAEREQMRIKAISLAEEAMEAVRSFRDNTDWDINGVGILNVNTDYGLAVSGMGWDIVLGDENINSFTRSIIFENVSRDLNDDIESIYNISNDDSDTKKVTVIVSWIDRQGSASESLKTYFTNWKN